ncbi:MAG: PrsW family glutamic-type intramembrane protease [Clostridia bacterium]|nr:PrsW family glutamic-type intramembrane protease [Clostridia bacterium]
MYILVASAVIPAIVLLRYIYKIDRLEKEPPHLIIKLLALGIASTYIALILETIGFNILDLTVNQYSNRYDVIMFFIIVGPAEELAKYIMLKIGSWKDPDFNCQFDAVVYAVTVSLGFALWENIKYVFSYGFSTAIVRAFTAVPGHASFGVFMGIWYGVAKKQELRDNYSSSKTLRIISVVFPAIIHGAYDYIATISEYIGNMVFIVFIAIMFFICFKAVKRLSLKDRYLDDTNRPTIIDV